MLVYICCAGGATSSLFCKKIGDASKVPTTVEDIFTVLKNYDEYDNKYEIILAYGPAEFLKERCIREYNLGEKISSIWIAPQERFYVADNSKKYLQSIIPR